MYKRALSFGLLVILVDQVTKWWAENALGNGERISVIGDFLTFVLVYNPGAAFSLGTGSTWIFTIFSVVVVTAIMWVLRKCESRAWAITLGIIAGGAVGNLIDRVFREPSVGQGHVVDFISYNGWFVGNVADIALVLGVIALVIIELLGIECRGSAPVEEAADE
ncbi:signal peptidase II [Flaviflexus huanghaiensis]|uniref:signal peptidase II n=1 Tax=Flaviflexus huanghaiensis TaxID=1111473 RepID=UPI0015F7E7C2|nr:signal peptidase II [Flaviflexus huanghaiensis]